MDVKKCNACGEVKPVDQFHKRGGKEGGYRSKCKPCQNASTKQTSSDWKRNNPDRVKAYAAQWHQDNPGAKTAIEATRRARLAAAILGPIDWSMLRTVADCYLCGKPLEGPTCMDHIIPLARGGAHCTANLLPTHRLCNERKQALLLSELSWYSGPTDLGVSL